MEVLHDALYMSSMWWTYSSRQSVPIPFLQFDDYQTVVELDENEKELLAILLSNREFMETLNNLEYCTLFIRRKSVDKDVEQNIFDVERACDFLSISQYRYDKKECRRIIQYCHTSDCKQAYIE